MIKTGVNETEEKAIEKLAEEVSQDLIKKGSKSPEVKVVGWTQEEIKVEVSSEDSKEIKTIDRTSLENNES